MGHHHGNKHHGHGETKKKTRHHEGDDVGKLHQATKHKHAPAKGATAAEIERARGDALTELLDCSSAMTESVDGQAQKLVDAWSTYLGVTTQNPTLSPNAFGGESGLFDELKESFAVSEFAKIRDKKLEQFRAAWNSDASTVPLETAEHEAGHGAAEGAGEVAKDAAGAAGEVAEGEAAVEAGEAGAEVGSVAGPEGTVIGFAIGVLLDIAASHIYEALTGGDDGIDKAIQDAYDQGFRDGASTAASLIKAKAGDIFGFAKTARQAGSAHIKEYSVALHRAQDLKSIQELSARIKAETATLQSAVTTSADNIARRLLREWVDEHAGRGKGVAAKDVNQAEYTKAQDMLPSDRQYDVSNPEDMKDWDSAKAAGKETFAVPFEHQLRHEWGLRGLPPPTGFEAALAKAKKAAASATTKADETGTHIDQGPSLKSVIDAINGELFSWNYLPDTWMVRDMFPSMDPTLASGWSQRRVEGRARINDDGYLTAFDYKLTHLEGDEFHEYTAEPGDYEPKSR